MFFTAWTEMFSTLQQSLSALTFIIIIIVVVIVVSSKEPGQDLDQD